MIVRSLTRSSVIAAAIAGLCVVGLSACNRSEETALVELKISRAGIYYLQGREVPSAELKYELKALRQSPGSVVLHIAADPMATFDAVGIATKAAQEAGIGSVAYVTSGPAK